MRVLCPHCRQETVKTADLTPTSIDIESWEIGPDGRPMPADYGGGVAFWEAAVPEYADRPYLCAPCFEYLSADMLVVVPDPETT